MRVEPKTIAASAGVTCGLMKRSPAPYPDPAYPATVLPLSRNRARRNRDVLAPPPPAGGRATGGLTTGVPGTHPQPPRAPPPIRHRSGGSEGIGGGGRVSGGPSGPRSFDGTTTGGGRGGMHRAVGPSGGAASGAECPPTTALSTEAAQVR